MAEPPGPRGTHFLVAAYRERSPVRGSGLSALCLLAQRFLYGAGQIPALCHDDRGIAVDVPAADLTREARAKAVASHEGGREAGSMAIAHSQRNVAHANARLEQRQGLVHPFMP